MRFFRSIEKLCTCISFISEKERGIQTKIKAAQFLTEKKSLFTISIWEKKMNINYELLLQQRKKLEDDVHEQVEQDSRTLFCNLTSSDRRLVKVSESVCSPLWVLQSGVRPDLRPPAILKLETWLAGWPGHRAGWLGLRPGWMAQREAYVRMDERAEGKSIVRVVCVLLEN